MAWRSNPGLRQFNDGFGNALFQVDSIPSFFPEFPFDRARACGGSRALALGATQATE
jgi:hypothetical protein